MIKKEKIKVGDLIVSDLVEMLDQCGKYGQCSNCRKENPVLHHLCNGIEIKILDDEILHYEVEI